MLLTHKKLMSLTLASVVSIAGCSSHSDSSEKKPTIWAAGTSSKPLTAAQVNIIVAIKGEPMLTANGQDIAVGVTLTNNGKTMLSSSGTKPVNLGAHSVDASGNIITQDLARVSLPNILPGTSDTVTILLPVAGVLNHSAQILPVQESVAWFNAFGTKPLTVGPFTSCSNASLGKVCDAQGKPLPTMLVH